MLGLLKDTLPKGYDTAEHFNQVGDTFIASNSLTIVYAPAGHGKSYALTQVIGSEEAIEHKVFLDFDNNAYSFKEHCLKYNIEYVNMDYVQEPAEPVKQRIARDDKKNKKPEWPEIIPFKVKVILDALPRRTTVVFDSLSSMKNEDPTGKVMADILYALAKLAGRYNINIVVIDHATKTRDKFGKVVDFKIEGNESFKTKPAASVVRYDIADLKNPAAGGTFTVMKSRLDTVRIGDKFNIVKEPTLKDAILRLAETKVWADIKIGNRITQSDFTNATKNEKYKFIRKFQEQMFHSEKEHSKAPTHLKWRLPGQYLNLDGEQCEEIQVSKFQFDHTS